MTSSVAVVSTKLPLPAAAPFILSAEALAFLGALHARFDARRMALLAARVERQKSFDAGVLPDFRADTKGIREDASWRVVAPHPHIADRRVEITGPVERRMMINALNSGARCFMADFEDATSPTFENVIEGQQNCYDAVRGTIGFATAEKTYTLKETGVAQLLVRPRGWHLPEKNITCGGTVMSASLVDFGLYAFHNIAERARSGSGLFLYVPKLESHEEAALWADVFRFTEGHFGLPVGTIRATVLIETITAAFEMEEILYVLRDHSAGLNAGRWDYIFSAIKKFRNRADFTLPDRGAVTMAVPFMKAYAELLVKTCHKRGAHAMGGMAAFVPSRKDAAVNEKAFAAVKADKEREARAGFDGTWVAHPDLIPVAQAVFDAVLGAEPNQISRQRDDVQADAGTLLALSQTPGAVTLAGVRLNIDVAIQYLNAWLNGIGAAAIHNLMEDAATAEISRAQLWQWRRNGVRTDTGESVDADLYKRLRSEELEKLIAAHGAQRFAEAARLLDDLVLKDSFEEFLTLPAYAYLT